MQGSGPGVFRMEKSHQEGVRRQHAIEPSKDALRDVGRQELERIPEERGVAGLILEIKV